MGGDFSEAIHIAVNWREVWVRREAVEEIGGGREKETGE